jgi:tRNA A37 methylthiotransferase MiaB
LPTGKIRAIRFFHQSGSNRILRLMNRPYTRESALQDLLSLKAVNPRIKLITQIIVGFPSETEADFDDSCDFVTRVRFDRIEVFPYSIIEDTPAARMKGQIAEPIKRERRERIMSLLK